jgi:hypothetical protein
MKRAIPFAVCVAGILGLFYLMPWFNAAQPVGARITRGEAERLPTRSSQTRHSGRQDIGQSDLTDSAILEKELEKSQEPGAPRSDPVIGRASDPRRAYYRPAARSNFPWAT